MGLLLRSWWVLAAGLVACEGGGAAEGEADAGADAALDAATAPGDAEPSADAAPPLALRVVPGDLVFAEGEPGDLDSVHLYSATADGALRHRLTRHAGGWTFSSVGPDPRYVAAVRHGDADGDGRADPDGARAVWVVDVRSGEAYPVTPADCDAGIGGVGWRDEFHLMLAMRCGDEASAAYLVNRDNRGREREKLLKVSDHAEPVRDVFPAVGTPLYAYVVDARTCAGRECVTKPQVWVADHAAAMACRVTDGDAGLRDGATASGGGEVRLGDHHPAFAADLSSLVFSRNVAGKPAGPEGHHDLFRIGLDVGALYAGGAECGRASSLERLSDVFIDDDYARPDGRHAPADERYPAPAAGRAPAGTLLLTAEAHDAEGTVLRQVYFVDVDGSRRALGPARRAAGHARWIVDRYTRAAR